MAEELAQAELTEKQAFVQSDKDFNRNKWFFCVGGIGRDALYTLVSTYFLQYVQFGLTLTVAQFLTLSLVIGIAGRIWDGVNDPMMGAIIDGVHLKWGKFRPWIFLGALLDAIFTVLLFNIRPFSTATAQGWLYVAAICGIYLLWEAAFTMNDIGYWSMIPSLARTKDRRDKMTTLTIFFAGLGTIIMTALVTFLSPGNLLNSYTIFSIIAAVGVVAFQTLTTFGVKEAPREASEEKKENKVSFKKMLKTIFSNKQLLWMALALLCYSTSGSILLSLVYNLYYMEIGYDGNVIVFVVLYALANTLIQLLYPPMAKKLGRKKMQTIAIIAIATGYAGLMALGWFKWFPMTLVTLCIFGLLVFVGQTWFYTATLVNMSNCVEYNELHTGERNESVVSTVRPLIVKFADAIKYLVVTLTLVLSGIYFISQSVSSIEGQISQFKNKVYITTEKDITAEDRYDSMFKYVTTMNGWIVELDATELEYGKDSSEYEAKIKEIDDKIASDSNYELFKECQVQAQYLQSVGNLYLCLVEKDGGKEVINTYAQLDDTAGLALVMSHGKDAVYSLRNNPNSDHDKNAVNQVYAEVTTPKARIFLRVSSCLVPLILMIVSWLVQRYKFIIDEKYYDEMMVQIEANRTKALAEGLPEGEHEVLEAEEPKEE